MRGQLLVVILLSGLFDINSSSGPTQTAKQTPEWPHIDLTTPAPANQQGLGLPGGSAGGIVGGPQAVSIGPRSYQLPLRVEILHTSVGKDGDFILEVQLQNTGQTAFNLPVSRNISDVQRTPSVSRRQFFFRIRAVPSKSHEVETVGFAATAGSVTAPHSSMRLEPQESVRILLRAESRLVRKAMPTDAKQLDVKVICGEWTFDDNRFVVQAEAQDLTSTNTAILGFQADTPAVPTSQR